jgi:hypothetical protein
MYNLTNKWCRQNKKPVRTFTSKEILRDASTYIFGKMKKHNIGGFYWDTCISVKITYIVIPVSLSKLLLLGYLYLCQNYVYWDTCISVKITSIGIPVSLSYYFYWDTCTSVKITFIGMRYRYPNRRKFDRDTGIPIEVILTEIQVSQ